MRLRVCETLESAVELRVREEVESKGRIIRISCQDHK